MEPPKGPFKFVRFEPREQNERRFVRRQPDPVDPRDPLPPRPFFPTASPPPPPRQNGLRITPFSLEDPTAKPPPRPLFAWPTFSSRLGANSHRVFAEELKWKTNGVFNPHGGFIRQWNKVFVVACLAAAAVDPLFFFLVEVDLDNKCVQIERSFAVTVTVLRCCPDLVYFLQMLLQFRVAYVEPSSRIFGRGELVVDKKSIARHYLMGNFALDFVAWLPIPQFVLWVVMFNFQQPGTASAAKNWLRFVVVLQYIPRIIRMIPIQTSLHRPGTLAFETASSGFVINLLIFLLASHVIAAVWYLLGVERVDHCWRQVCANETAIQCSTDFFDCASLNDTTRMAWNISTNVTDLCGQQSMPSGNTTPYFNYGIYQPILKIIATLGVKRYFFSLWWGLKNLTSMGQPLLPSTFTGEIWFCIIIALVGMLLLAMLVGNMQKYLQSLGRRVEEHRTALRDTEAWMKHRQLPPELRKRVRQFDQFRWSAMHGVDEEKLLEALPEDLARDIKRHLCLDRVMKVPLFERLDYLVLDAICERLKPQLFIAGSCIIREGDPAFRMLFIIKGTLRSFGRSNTAVDTVTLTSGDFVGDELLTWCLDPRPKQYYPSSLRTVVADSPVEAFSLNADDLRYVTGHFLGNKKRMELRRALRFYSPHWRIWGALAIQAAWRRYKRNKDRKGKAPESSAQATTTAYYIQMFLENARRVKAREQAEACDMFDGEMSNTVHASKTFQVNRDREPSGNGDGDVGGNDSTLRRRPRRGGLVRPPPPLETGGDALPLLSPTLKRVPTPTEQFVDGFADGVAGSSNETSGTGRRDGKEPLSSKIRKPPPVELPSSPTHQRVPTPTDEFGVGFEDWRTGAEGRTLRQRRGGEGLGLEAIPDPFSARDRVPSLGRALIGQDVVDDLSVPVTNADAFTRIPSTREK